MRSVNAASQPLLDEPGQPPPKLLDVAPAIQPASAREKASRERRIQVLFTAAMTACGAMMLVSMTYETRWISHRLGPVQMGAYAIAHSAKNYVENVRALWGGSAAGRNRYGVQGVHLNREPPEHLG